MEYALPELLTRDDILHILLHRRLNIPDIHELNYDELVRIYKMFVVPLSRRPQRHRKPLVHDNDLHIDNEMEIDMSTESLHIPPTTPAAVSPQITRFQCDNALFRTLNLNEKRRPGDVYGHSVTDYQYQLSSATKRIKISLT